jgi:NAD(P)-dependent dehydrogenase (short-subunit alcohol dehydrogenase family)
MPARTWLITGVSSGFGRELTTQLLERGDRVVGTVRRPEAAADLVERYRDATRSTTQPNGASRASSNPAPKRSRAAGSE